MAGATGTIKGYLGVHHNAYDNNAGNQFEQAAFAQFGANITGVTSVVVDELIAYENPTEWVFAFKFALNASNLVQKNWNTLSVGGSIGVASGILEITYGSGGLKYLAFPKRCFSFYGGSGNNNVYVFVTCDPPSSK